tara:strand:+ start:467 stop:730 length:264 start_codon:yes stop_codon:yes gene_type:complete
MSKNNYKDTILDAVSTRANIDRKRLDFSQPVWVDFAPRISLLLDGEPIKFAWSPEPSSKLEKFDSDSDLFNAMIDQIVETLNGLENE